jgi:O-antigen ligase
MAAALVMTYTRAVWIGVFVGLGLIQIGDRRVRAAFLVLILCAALALSAALVLAPSDSILTKRATALGPIYGRIVFLATAAKLVAARPLFGYGFSRYAFQEAKGGNLSTIGMVSAKWGSGLYAVHNEYLNVAIMLGLAGLSLYVMILVSAGRSLLAFRRDAGHARFLTKEFALFALGACSIYVFAGLFVNLIGMSFLSGLTYLLVGVVEARTLRRGSGLPTLPSPEPSSSLNRATFVK